MIRLALTSFYRTKTPRTLIYLLPVSDRLHLIPAHFFTLVVSHLTHKIGTLIVARRDTLQWTHHTHQHQLSTQLSGQRRCDEHDGKRKLY